MMRTSFFHLELRDNLTGFAPDSSDSRSAAPALGSEYTGVCLCAALETSGDFLAAFSSQGSARVKESLQATTGGRIRLEDFDPADKSQGR